MADLLLGVDIGTSSCKTILLDSLGDVIDSERHEYPMSSPQEGWAEQNPADWYSALKATVRLIAARHPEIAEDLRGIGVTGQMIGLVVLDSEGEPLMPSIIWMDQRSSEEICYLKKHHGELITKHTLNPVNSAYTLPKMLWLKNNRPNLWSRLYRLQLPKDYVRLRLTGTWNIDYSDASGTLLFDVARLCWSEDVIEAVGIDRDKLPEVVLGSTVVGTLLPSAATDLGLTAGVPVVAGTGDLAAENLAAGIISDRNLLTRLGTAGSTSTCSPRPMPDPSGISPCYAHCIDGRWLVEIADHSFGLCERWFREQFYGHERKAAADRAGDFYLELDRLAESVPIGCEGLIFHPFNSGGPYWNPHLRGSFYGIGLRSEKRHFLRAMFEGSTYCLKDSILMIQERIGRSDFDYRLVGGGSKSPFWCRMICDILRKDATVLKTADAALGAAMLAGIGTGLFESVGDSIARCVHFGNSIRYSEANSRRYDEAYSLYQTVHEGLMASSVRFHDAVERLAAPAMAGE